MDFEGNVKTHLEKIMSIDGFCEMPHSSKQVFLFMMGTLKQEIVQGQQVAILDPDAKKLCDTYIAGITIGSDDYSKTHKSAPKGEEVQLIVGTNFNACPELKTRAKYLCATIFED
ncbi:MAG: hypothetical protein II699_06780 [Lachnospiraceae bacterium]|jgi:hypothetical protein|nr:hypothetical protein [Lachnospiraceae bacterium]